MYTPSYDDYLARIKQLPGDNAARLLAWFIYSNIGSDDAEYLLGIGTKANSDPQFPMTHISRWKDMLELTKGLRPHKWTFNGRDLLLCSDGRKLTLKDATKMPSIYTHDNCGSALATYMTLHQL